MSEQKPAIAIKSVSKTFLLPVEKHSTVKSLFVNIFKRNKFTKQKALQNVDFQIEPGEFFGIVGRNGSGKSTLLKIIAGIYNPSSGHVKVNGSLTPFIELGVGFNPELTGRENVFLNGALLGFNRKEMSAMYDEIVEFAELERFMDQKLKNYSSGMQVRLAFSIAIRAQSDILLLDEVLAVGDAAFQQKCYEYFAKLKKEKKTVILVTHSMDNILQFCTQAMLMDGGRIVEMGNPLKIAQLYNELNSQDNTTVNKTKNKPITSTKYVSAKVKYKKTDDKHILDINLEPKTNISDPIVAVGIYSSSGEQIYRWTSDEKIPFKLKLKSHSQIKIELGDVFPVGNFTVSLFVKKRDRTVEYAAFNDIVRFGVKNVTPYKYATFWKIPEKTLVNDEEIESVH